MLRSAAARARNPSSPLLLAWLTAAAGCAAGTAPASAPAPPPAQDRDPLRGRGPELLAAANERFAAGDVGRARPLYKLAAEAAERDGARPLAAEALARVAHCYALEGAGPELGAPYLRRAADAARPEEPRGWQAYLEVAALYERLRGQPVEAIRLAAERFLSARSHGSGDAAAQTARSARAQAEEVLAEQRARARAGGPRERERLGDCLLELARFPRAEGRAAEERRFLAEARREWLAAGAARRRSDDLRALDERLAALEGEGAR